MIAQIVDLLGPWLWWVVGLLLAGVEILAPGSFFVWCRGGSDPDGYRGVVRRYRLAVAGRPVRRLRGGGCSCGRKVLRDRRPRHRRTSERPRFPPDRPHRHARDGDRRRLRAHPARRFPVARRGAGVCPPADRSASSGSATAASRSSRPESGGHRSCYRSVNHPRLPIRKVASPRPTVARARLPSSAEPRVRPCAVAARSSPWLSSAPPSLHR